MNKKSKIICILLYSFIVSVCFSKPISEPFILNKKLEKNILDSKLRIKLKNTRGQQFSAYLFAINEKKYPLEKNLSCHSGKIEAHAPTFGKYYIYLYDIERKRFISQRIPIFGEDSEQTFNFDGAEIQIIPSLNPQQADILLVSQFGDCSYNEYEAYGFTSDGNRLERYTFTSDQKKQLFRGFVYSGYKVGLYGYGAYGPDGALGSVMLTVSDQRGEVRVSQFSPIEEKLSGKSY